MSIETFLNIARQRGFLDEATYAKLREKLRDPRVVTSTDELAAMLLRQGILTARQIDKLQRAVQEAVGSDLELLGEDSPDDFVEDVDSSKQDSTFSLTPKSRKTNKSKNRELELLSDDDAPESTLLSAKLVDPLKPEFGDTPTDLLATPFKDSDSAGSSWDNLDSIDEGHVGSVLIGVPPWRRMVAKIFRSKRARGQQWDSSLMLVGGGVLMALLLLFGFLYFALAVGSGDDMFQLADDDYHAQLYGQAIQKYERYLQRFPRHEKASLARTRVGLAQIRTQLSTQDWLAAIAAVASSLPSLREESSFDQARSELAGILPEIYAGVVQQAASVPAVDDKERLLLEAQSVFEWIENPDYLPASLRRQVQGRIDTTRDQAQQINREVQRRRDIEVSLTKIRQAIDSGQPLEAYQIRDALLMRHPGAVNDAALQAALITISETEHKSIRVTELAVAASQEERKSWNVDSIILSGRKPGDAEQLDGRIVLIRARGALYGLDGKTGEILWRRWLGFESDVEPVRVSGQAYADILTIDQRFGDLMRLNGRTGELVWRSAVGTAMASPVLVADGVLQATAEGALIWIDLQTGALKRRVEFPQGLTSPPAIDRQESLIFQVADHSTMYVLDARSLECQRTIYIGHQSGMVSVAPAITRDLILLVENGATDYCLLHVLARGKDGSVTRAGEPLRLQGVVAESPLVQGRNVLVATDRGAVYMMEIDTSNLAAPISVFAQVHPRLERTTDHFALLAKNRIIVAGLGLAEYEIQAARGLLERRWSEQLEDAHLTAPQLVNDTLITARWSSTHRDMIVSASRWDGSDGRPPTAIWETRLAAQPAATARITAARTVEVYGRNGLTWEIDGNGVRNKQVAATFDEPQPVAHVKFTPDGARLVTYSDDRPAWLYQGPQDARLRSVRLQQSARQRTSIPPTLLGNRLLVALTSNQVHYVDPSTGDDLAAPLPITTESPGLVELCSPVVLDNESALIATRAGHIMRVNAKFSSGSLAVVQARDLNVRIHEHPVFLDDRIFVLVRSRAGDELWVLDAESLQSVHQWPLTTRATAAPMVVEGRVIVLTGDSWQAFQGDGLLWHVPLPLAPLAGPPHPADGAWLCASRDGRVAWIDPATGLNIPWPNGELTINVGQALDTELLMWGKTILAVGHDATLHVIPKSLGGEAP